ncbi:MAG: DUF5654 family protein [Candidatus Pacearchaeota archaeon]|nr:DUF5654 family protein [Candidatus Pacearchaeota archaeon]
MKPQRLKNLQAKGREMSQETRERMAAYMTAALGLVVALAWNDAIKGLIEGIFPLSRGTVTAKFIYAFLLTLVVVFVTRYFVSQGSKEKQ